MQASVGICSTDLNPHSGQVSSLVNVSCADRGVTV
jgi:hypothetical protein